MILNVAYGLTCRIRVSHFSARPLSECFNFFKITGYHSWQICLYYYRYSSCSKVIKTCDVWCRRKAFPLCCHAPVGSVVFAGSIFDKEYGAPAIFGPHGRCNIQRGEDFRNWYRREGGQVDIRNLLKANKSWCWAARLILFVEAGALLRKLRAQL